MSFLNKFNLYLPTNQQKLLLQATLFQGDKALNAWHQWEKQVDIAKLDSESFHLLSLLYRNLSTHQVKDDRIKIIKGVYRRTWCANQLLIQRVQTILNTFHEAEIQTIMLGDAALVSNYYRDFGHRPIYTLNFLIHPSDIDKVKDLLASLDYHLKHTLTDRLYFDIPNEVGRSLFIHPILFKAEPQEHTNKQLWHYAISTEFSDLTSQVLSHTDQFLYVCSQGFIKHQSQQIRCLADAMIILQTSGNEIDWIRLVTQAQRYELLLPLKNMLNLLTEILEVKIPDWILPSLRKMPVSHFELLEYQVFLDNKMLAVKSALLRISRKISWRLKPQLHKQSPPARTQE
jgi:hypothetical protein